MMRRRHQRRPGPGPGRRRRGHEHRHPGRQGGRQHGRPRHATRRKLIEIVEIGKQLLITRGALTTFSIANDVAKYFAIIPAMFVAALPALGALNVMGLASPQSAILSAVIFNALIIVALIPLALRGREVPGQSAPRRCCSRNLLDLRPGRPRSRPSSASS